MNPTEYTPQLAMNPSTDAATLSAICQYRPDLRAYVAANPALYPELRAWLQALGDPYVNQALAQNQGYMPPPTGTQPAVGPGVYAPAPDSSGQYSQPYATQGNGQAAGPLTGGMPAVGQAVSTGMRERKKKKKTGLIVTLSIILGLLVIGGVVLALWLLGFFGGKAFTARGASSPEEALETAALAVVKNGDIYSAADMISNEELGMLQQAAQGQNIQGLVLQSGDVGALADVVKAAHPQLENLKVDRKPLNDELALARIKGGKLTFKPNQDELKAALENLLARRMNKEAAKNLISSFTGSGDWKHISRGDTVDLKDANLQMVTIRDGEKWFISPLLTLNVDSFRYREKIPTITGEGYATAQEAIQAIPQIIADIKTSRENVYDAYEKLLSKLTKFERYALAYASRYGLYSLFYPDKMPTSTKIEFGPVQTTGRYASAEILKVETENRKQKFVTSFPQGNDCIEMTVSYDSESKTHQLCISQVFDAMGIKKGSLPTINPHVYAYQEDDGKWYLSLLGTATSSFGPVAKIMDSLAQTGDMDKIREVANVFANFIMINLWASQAVKYPDDYDFTQETGNGPKENDFLHSDDDYDDEYYDDEYYDDESYDENSSYEDDWDS